MYNIILAVFCGSAQEHNFKASF